MAQSSYSAAMERYVHERLGISVDEPHFRRVVTTLFGARRRGVTFDDAATVAHYVEIARQAHLYDEWQREQAEGQCFVYYVRIGPHIKIGTAKDLRLRLASYPPSAVVLAIEPGSYQKEAERLSQFAEYLSARKEWFDPGPRLMEHIGQIRDVALLRVQLDGFDYGG